MTVVSKISSMLKLELKFELSECDLFHIIILSSVTSYKLMSNFMFQIQKSRVTEVSIVTHQKFFHVLDPTSPDTIFVYHF